MPIDYALNTRSAFSIGEALFNTEAIVNEAVRLGYKGAALVETMSVSSMIEFTGKAKKAGIKPIIGVRLRIVDDPTQRKLSKADKEAGIRAKVNRTWYLKLYALNADGLSRIMRLLSKANTENYFYVEPRLSFADVLAELDPLALAVSTGDFYSVFHLSEYRDIVAQIVARLSATQTFVELCPIATPLFDTINQKAVELARELDLPTLVTYPALYAKPEEAETLGVLNAISRNVKINEPWANKQWVKDFTFKSPRELAELAVAAGRRLQDRGIPGTGQWAKGLMNINKLADLVTWQWAKMPISLPVMAADPYEALLAQCKVGWGKRFGRETFGHKPTHADLLATYKPRLKYELDTLKNMGFENYFLLVQDLVVWAKTNGILVGPGRGSVGGSLVAYLLGITDVDPIRFNLLFERFINPERLDLPDADLDFMSARRHEITAYLTEKYGADRVAGISNYGTLASGSALRDTARVYGTDMSTMTLTKFVPKEHGKPLSLDEAAKQVPEIDKYRMENPEIWHHAQALEGVMRNYGRHAAGVVVGGVPLEERSVVERRGGEPTINWDKRIVEDAGLVKMDILGLSTLDVLELCVRQIWKRHTKRIDLYDVPLEDPEVMVAFGRGETIGVFQFESPGMRKLLKDLASGGTLTFEDLAAATALYRPGPMDSGLMDDYVQIKQGVGSPRYEHPNMVAALEATGSVIVYQEQVMQLARDLAGFTMAGADHLRKAMGKKDKDMMAKQRAQWVAGCLSHSGMPERAAADLFDKIEKFAGYGFNRSHAVEYSLISYLSMWLKVKYPVEFYAASMTIMDEDKLPSLMRDAGERKIEVLPPDINNSSGIFEILNDLTLLIPFNRLKGISDNTTGAILKAREAGPFKDKADFLARVHKGKCNIRHQDVLERVGAFARIEPGQKPATDESRIKDQMELMPGLNIRAVRVDRKVTITAFGKAKLDALVEEYRACDKCPLTGACHPKPFLGKEAKMMIITDGPTWSEEAHDKIAQGQSFSYVSEAMGLAELARKDAYFTTLIKSPKPEGEKFFSNETINACTDYLRREIEIIKPPVIVALGSAAARYFVKDLKGGIMEHAGKTLYSAAMDATIVIGISPGMVSFDASKQGILNDIFKLVADLVR